MSFFNCTAASKPLPQLSSSALVALLHGMPTGLLNASIARASEPSQAANAHLQAHCRNDAKRQTAVFQQHHLTGVRKMADPWL